MAKYDDGTLNVPAISNNAFNNQKQKARIFYIAALTGLSGHFLFIFFFIVLNQTTLAWLNVLSVAIWLTTFWSNKHRRYDISSLIMSVEIITHAALVTSILGAASGFHYYLWPIALLVMAVPALPIFWSTIIALLSITTFGLLSVFCNTQLSELAPYYLFVHVFNLAMASIPFIITAATSRLVYESQYLKIARLAEKDDLTQLFNRRFGQKVLNYYFQQVKRDSPPFCIALIDVDHFKQINDKLGHSAGDEVLINITRYLSSTLRDTDICCRWGGEEFLFILPNTEVDAIESRLEIMCKEMPEQIVIPNLDKPVSCSFGLIQAKPEESLEDALKRVDRLLYQAKKNGRYQVVSDHSKSFSI